MPASILDQHRRSILGHAGKSPRIKPHSDV
jgi:hypothetical protein